MIVLTANQRLARALRRDYNAAQRARGLAAWPSPAILPLSQWVEQCHDAERPVLSRGQESAIWESIIAASAADSPLLDVTAAARAAAETWSLIQAWRVPLDHAAWDRTEDSRMFKRWAAGFHARIGRDGWLDDASLMDRIASPTPSTLEFVGFDEFTPQQAALIERLRAAGCTIAVAEPALDSPVRAERVGHADSERELRAAALWARETLERRGSASIGIVVPRLNALRSAADRILRHTLGDDRPYHISLGVSLAGTPAVHAALLLLEAASGRIDLVRAGSLLRSPFTKGGEESAKRAALDARLRRRGELEIRASDLPWTIEPARGKKPPSAWAGWFAQALEEAGWPGGRKLSSEEYQAVQRWQGCLSEFASLDAFAPPMSHGSALSRVRAIAAETVFQAEASPAPIQVLGALEAAGSQFDALWVSGLHDGVWPAPARPDPFIPVALQRELNLPHSSAARELAFAQRTTARLLRCAPEAIVSYPMREGEEHLRPSPLILSLPERAQSEVAREDYAHIIHASALHEELADNAAPPPDASQAQRGGARIFKLQAACPFRAFAEGRLGATALEAGVPGLDPIGRGDLLHKALEHFWRSVPSQQALRKASAWEREASIGGAVSAAIELVRRDGPDSERFWNLEGKRVSALLRAWINEFELMRPPFEVLQPEAEQFAEIGGIRFRTRIDRIDRAHNDAMILIDYKSGVTALSSWEGKRPEEPQLPLYAVTQETPPSAIAFAQIRRGDSGFKGLAQTDGMLPGVSAAGDWQSKLASWREALTAIAASYLRGDATVDPAKPSTCDYCKLPSLCRIGTVRPAEE